MTVTKRSSWKGAWRSDDWRCVVEGKKEIGEKEIGEKEIGEKEMIRDLKLPPQGVSMKYGF